MSRMLGGGHDFLEAHEAEQPRDVVLGTTALLSIFFLVAVVCAVCFGYGYSRGHGGSAPVAKQKPEPRPLGGRAEPALAAQPQPLPAPQKPSPGAAAQVAAEEQPGELPGMPPQAAASQPMPRATARSVSAAIMKPASAPSGSPLNLMVQIAAVSHEADADTLASALRRNGFRAVVRTAPADPLFHVQVGPFATLDAAKAMRSRLVDSGYNAFIKP